MSEQTIGCVFGLLLLASPFIYLNFWFLWKYAAVRWLIENGWHANIYADSLVMRAPDEKENRSVWQAWHRQRALNKMKKLNLPDPERDPRPVSFMESEL